MLGFDIGHLVAIGIFLLEIGLSCACIDGYFCSFFFWIDLVSAVSITLDVSLLNDFIYEGDVRIIGSSDYSLDVGNKALLSTNSKVSRAATRVVRLFKLLRLLRIVKLYRSAVKAK